MFSSKHHVLYFENHDDTRWMIQMMLEKSNFRVTATGDDKQCLELLKKNHYDLILLEHGSFGASGFSLCSTIRESDRETPILFFSSHAYDTDKTAARQAGAQGYLVKPDDLCRIAIEVSRLIGERSQTKIHHPLSKSYFQTRCRN